MLIVYNLYSGVVKFACIMGENPSKAEILKLSLVESLPESQTELRIFDINTIRQIRQALDSRAQLTVALDNSGNPIGIKADGQIIVSASSLP